MASKLSEEETIALIHYYGGLIAGARGRGIDGVTRADMVRWGERIVHLAKTLPARNPSYLCEEPR